MLDRKLIYSYFNLAMNCLNQDNYNTAIVYFNKLINLEPDNPDHYYERGLAYRRKALFENSNSEPNTQGSELFDQSNRDLEEAVRLYEQREQ